MQSQDQPPINAGDRVKRGLGLELTISGARPQQNNYLLDGVNINDYANAGPGSVLGGNLGTDAVAEFSVLTTNYSTEYGRTSGGIITATTKSGTNQFHGSAYEFLRNACAGCGKFHRQREWQPESSPFVGTNMEDRPADQFKRTRRLFLAITRESSRPWEPLPFPTCSRQMRERKLNMCFPNGSSSYPTNCIDVPGKPNQCQVTVDPNIAKFLQLKPYPATKLGRLRPVPGSLIRRNLLSRQCRLRRRISSSSGRTTPFHQKTGFLPHTFLTKPHRMNQIEYQTKLINNPMFRQMVAIEENHVFSPSLLNSFRVGFNRDNVESPSGATADQPCSCRYDAWFRTRVDCRQYRHRLGWPGWLPGGLGCGRLPSNSIGIHIRCTTTCFIQREFTR